MAKLAYIECGNNVKLYIYANTLLYNDLVSRYGEYTSSRNDRLTVPTLNAHNPPDDATFDSIMTTVSGLLYDPSQIWRSIPIKYLFRTGQTGNRLINQTDFINLGTKIFYNATKISYDTNFSERRTNIYYNGDATGCVTYEWIPDGQTNFAEGPYESSDSTRFLLGYAHMVSYASNNSGGGLFEVSIPIVPESCIDTGVFTLPPNFDTTLNVYNNYYYIKIGPSNDSRTNWLKIGKNYLRTTAYNQYNNDSSPFMTGVLIGAPVTLVAQDDPYTPDNDEGEGGTGDNDTDSDEIEIPENPTSTVISTGLFTMYNPTLSELESLADKLYDTSIVADLNNFFNKPIDAIMALNYAPVLVPITVDRHNVFLGNIDTGINMFRVTSQYVTYNMGSVTLKEFWGNFADYNPMTKISLYLPYIGIREVNTDDVMTATNTLKYKVDLLTGACVALLTCVKASDNKQGELNSVLYQWQGNLFTPIPITSEQHTNFTGSIINALTTGAATAAFNSTLAVASTIAIGVNALKHEIKHSDIISTGASNLAVQYPYFIINRPIMAKPSNYNTFYGLPSIMNRAVSELAGWTEFDEVRVNIQIATDEEKAELTELLKTGVFL